MRKKKRYWDMGHGRYRIVYVIPGSIRDKSTTRHNPLQKRKDRRENRERRTLSFDELMERGIKPNADAPNPAEEFSLREEENQQDEILK